MNHLWTLARSSVSSLIVIVVEVLLIMLLDAASVPHVVSYAAVQVVGTTITFVLNKLWVFGAGKSGTVFAEGTKAIAVFGGSLVLNTALPSIGSYVLHAPSVPSFLVSQMIVFLTWNYPLNRWWVFPARDAGARRRQEENAAEAP
jgi:putative flippase GtrA